jgi:hypothetical protein
MSQLPRPTVRELLLGRFICSTIWTNRRFGSTVERRQMASVSGSAFVCSRSVRDVSRIDGQERTAVQLL